MNSTEVLGLSVNWFPHFKESGTGDISYFWRARFKAPADILSVKAGGGFRLPTLSGPAVPSCGAGIRNLLLPLSLFNLGLIRLGTWKVKGNDGGMLDLPDCLRIKM